MLDSPSLSLYTNTLFQSAYQKSHRDKNPTKIGKKKLATSLKSTIHFLRSRRVTVKKCKGRDFMVHVKHKHVVYHTYQWIKVPRHEDDINWSTPHNTTH